MSTEALVRQIAQHLCKSAGDDWDAGKKFWTEQAYEILALVDEAKRSQRVAA